MKQQLKLVLVFSFFLFCGESKAQLDTLNYIKQFEINKANYIGKPFSKLLTDMTKIQPKTVWSQPRGRYKNEIKGSFFNFCEKEFSFHNVINLYVEWQEILPRDQVKFYETKNHFFFTNDEKTYYSTKIIKDIKVTRW